MTTFVYAITPQLTKKGAAIFIGTLLQKTNRFQRAPISGEIGALVSIYTRIPNEEDLRKPKGTLKFTKAGSWIHPISPGKSRAKIPDSGIPS